MPHDRSHFKKPQLDVHIRWLIDRDHPEVLEIERQSFTFPWSKEDLLYSLHPRNCIGMVAESKERIAGFMVYELLKNQVHLLNFAVAHWARHQGVGTQMMEKLVNKLSTQRRQEITLEVRETNLAAQLFFQKMQLLGSPVLREHFPDTKEDAYIMRYSLDPNKFVPFEKIQGTELLGSIGQYDVSFAELSRTGELDETGEIKSLFGLSIAKPHFLSEKTFAMRSSELITPTAKKIVLDNGDNNLSPLQILVEMQRGLRSLF